MRKWMLVAGLSALALLGMGATPRFLEELRIGGGYHEAVDGGVDLDKTGNVSADGKVVADGGIDAGVDGVRRGVVSVFMGGYAPGCLRLESANWASSYVFATNDGAGLRISSSLPALDTDGAYLASGKFRGTGSTTDAVDLSSAEVAGTLPASNVGTGLTDAQVADNLTISAGTVNNTPVGASVAASGRFTSLEATGDLLVDGGDIGVAGDTDLLGLSSDQLTVRGTLASSTGNVESGTENMSRGVVSAFEAAGAPGCLKLASASGTLSYVFATNDRAGLRIYSSLPTSDTNGAFLASGKFLGSGSTTDAVDLGTAEVAGTLPASSVGTGLTDAQVNDNLTISGGTINNTPIGASVASTAVFSKVTVNGAIAGSVVTITANDQTPDITNAHVCKVPYTWTPGHNIQTFDGGVEGQELVVIGGSPDCIVLDASHLRLAGNWTADEYDTLTLVYDGIDWIETGRSSN